jgi:hypothetical protein
MFPFSTVSQNVLSFVSQFLNRSLDRTTLPSIEKFLPVFCAQEFPGVKSWSTAAQCKYWAVNSCLVI